MGELLLSNKRGVKTYLLENTKWGAQVIRKVLDQPYPDENQVREFLSEYKLLKLFQVPGIRQLAGVDTEDDKPTTYFKYFDGITIKKLIENGKNDLNLVLSTGIFLTNMLSEIHSRKVIHKNISAFNILYNSQTQAFCLIDFGIASTIREKKNLSGGVEDLEGDIEYISPEQTGRINRRIDHRSDLYSTGILLYELATGSLPFAAGNTRKTIYGHIAEEAEAPIDRNPAVPKMLSKVILKLLEKDADNRYQSALGLKKDLLRIQSEFVAGKSSDFIIAEYDTAITLTLSQKLYGRDQELEELNSHLSDIAMGGFGIDMVYGYSGAGKSALVTEAFRTMASQEGYFLSGKFDQLQRNIPYYAIRQGLQDFFQLLLTEDGSYIDNIRDRIQKTVGSDIALITEIVPELEHIIGRQPEVERTSGLAGQNRFNYAFNKFLQAVTSGDRPIVFFLDDLQWADLASLNLLVNIFNNQQHQHLLIIGSFRDNEVNETHPVAQMISQCKRDGIKINHVEVKNLAYEDTLQLLEDSLGLTSTKAAQLAKTLFNHTDGNAFYITQIIQNLYDQGKLFYDERNQAWDWDKNVLSGIDIPENVVELMVQRVQRLDSTTQKLLILGSCFGYSFSIVDIQLLLNFSEEAITAALTEAQEEGFIEGEQGQFFFTQDRIQQAVYTLNSLEERIKAHFEIGLQLLNKHGDHVEKIFDVVDQLNFGIEEVNSSSERIQYAGLNLIAGKQAKTSTAYDAAMKYLETGLKFCENDWNDHYDLVLALHTNLAESAYLLGQYDKMAESITQVLENAKTLLEQIPVYKLEIESLKSQNNLYAAVEKGLEVLARLNVKLPYKPNQLQVVFKLLTTRIRLIGKSPKSLGKLKEMKDPYMLAAMQILVSIGPAIYWASPNLTPLTIFRMLLASVRYGNTDESTFAYSTFGLLLCGVTGEIKLGNSYGQLALDLSEKVNLINRVKGTFNVYCFVHHWSHSLRASFKPFKEAHLLGLEAGDLEFSALSAYLFCNHNYYSGVPLPELEKDFRLYADEIRQIKQYTSLNYTLIHWQAAYNLMNETSNPVVFSGPVYQEVEMLPKHLEAKDKTALFKFHLQKMMLNYLFGKPAEALIEGEKATEYLDAVLGMYVTVAYHFYMGLVLATLMRQGSSGQARTKQLSELKSCIKKFKHWASHSPENNQHKYELLQAEYYAINNKHDRAILLYRRSIETAKNNKFLNEHALANELAGKYYLEQDQGLANYYLTNAYNAYEKWGARAKSKDLLHTYKLDSFIDSFVKSLNETYSFSTTSSLEKIDFNTITEAAEIISDQIDYDSLKRILLKILAENAGAQKALLFNVRNKIFSLEESWPDQSEITQRYPSTILEKAMDSGKIIVTDRAGSDIYFKNDEHIIKHGVRSALCLPLYHQNELIAVIYLENNMIYGAFSQNRLEFLKLLSGQIAISLKNASLYSNLNESYDYQVELKDAYSKFVPLDFLGFIGKGSILEVTLGDQVQEVVTIMFIDIVDYTTLSEQMTPKENFDFINGALRRIGPVMRKFNGVISQFLGDGAMAIFKESPDHALEAAIEIQEALRLYNEERKAKNRKSIGLGIGVHTGKVMLGIIGEQMRMDQNVISDNVNIASRVQDLTRIYNSFILFTGSTKSKLQKPDQFSFRYLGKTSLKGRQKEIEIFECFDDQTDVQTQQKIMNIESFQHAVEAYYDEEYETAIKDLEEVISKNPTDAAARLFLERSKKKIT